MRSFLIYIVTFLIVFSPFSSSAEDIRNEIKISTNTGGNTVNGETDGAEVTTGDTTTSINIKNNSNQTTQSDNSVKSKTQLQIETSGSGTSKVDVNLNTTQYQIVRENGQTRLTTTKEDGTQTETQLESGQTLRIGFSDLTQLEISSDDKGFQVRQNQSLVETDLPVSVNLEEERLKVVVDGNDVEVNLLPEELEMYVMDRRLLDSKTANIRLELENGVLGYRIDGVKQEKILRLFPVSISKTLFVPVSDQASYEESYPSSWQKILDIFAD